jgi:branched-subunit amino acid transport protein
MLWMLIAAMGIITYSLRLSVIAAIGRFAVPPALARALRFVPLAVLPAIIAPDVLAPGGVLDLSAANARVPAAALAVLVAWRTRNALATIGSGMAALWLLRAVLTRVGCACP